jgi:hypothetical protein
MQPNRDGTVQLETVDSMSGCRSSDVETRIGVPWIASVPRDER